MKTISLTIWLTFANCFPSLMTMPEQRQTGGSIRGQVFDNRFGLAVPEATVSVIREGRVQQSTSCNKDGEYEIKNLTYTEYTVSVESLGFSRTQRSVRIETEGQVLLNIPLKVGRLHDPLPIDVNGTVRVSENEPANSVTIVLVSPFDQQIAGTARTDQSGHYVLRVDDPGQYVLYAFKSGFKMNALAIILRPRLPREPYTADIVLSAFEL